MCQKLGPMQKLNSLKYDPLNMNRTIQKKYQQKEKIKTSCFFVFLRKKVYINGKSSVRGRSSLHGNYLGWWLAVNGPPLRLSPLNLSLPRCEDRLLTLLLPNNSTLC